MLLAYLPLQENSFRFKVSSLTGSRKGALREAVPQSWSNTNFLLLFSFPSFLNSLLFVPPLTRYASVWCQVSLPWTPSAQVAWASWPFPTTCGPPLLPWWWASSWCTSYIRAAPPRRRTLRTARSPWQVLPMRCWTSSGRRPSRNPQWNGDLANVSIPAELELLRMLINKLDRDVPTKTCRCNCCKKAVPQSIDLEGRTQMKVVWILLQGFIA